MWLGATQRSTGRAAESGTRAADLGLFLGLQERKVRALDLSTTHRGELAEEEAARKICMGSMKRER